ncbi:MAG: 2,3-bisphosphoglycerate-independent phosphoglycerate mutase [Clostridiales bacterium]|jgi:2,3-bisphosphoglycerate-independent phosphoglycerate mutase|nr:2,3-bisphosphoglycerate-independent phosphoglycerate mutase [Clostridiales bacterium]
MSNLEKRPVALLVLDGFGFNESATGNAVAAANTPNLDRYRASYPHTLVRTSGMAVGLPDGQMGNSEVGHTNIGAGRIVYQELTRITKSIQDGDFFENPALNDAVENARKPGQALHLFGLLSDGGVHSHNTHLYALLEMAKKADVPEVYIHCFYDGRDVPPDSAKCYTEELIKKTQEIGIGKIASIMGRYYAMDRDNRWERVEKAYRAMVTGEGPKAADPVNAVVDSYEAGVMDEFVLPTVIVENEKPVGLIKAGDSVIFFNFRPDRAREITRCFMQPDFSGFELPNGHFPLHYVTMTQYDKTFDDFAGLTVAYRPTSLENTFGEYISNQGLTQLRIAETEKYAHVTFFFNGGVEKEYPGEDRALISSPKVATYDLKPEMSAYEVTEEALNRIASDKYDVIILNFANCDMVGHTGVFDAAKAAVEAVDLCTGKVVDAILAKGGVVLITADHGNAEQMIDPDQGGPFTAHTTLPVELIVAGAGDVKLKSGVLADLAPTMLDIMKLDKPVEMTGTSLIEG